MNSDVVTLSDPSQHFQRNHRLLVLGFIPTRRKNGNRVLLKRRLAKDKVTGRGDCYTMSKRINISDFTRQFPELETASTKNVHIGLAVAKDFWLKIKDMVFSDQIVVPSEELLPISWAHTIGIVVLFVWKRSNIFLVFSTVEEMGEITLLKFCETNRLWLSR